MSDEMKRFLQEELKKEADQILQEVEADSEVADLKASEEIDERLYEQIRQYKEKQDAPEEVLSEQQQEWIRLGKIYQSKRKNRKYVVLATAMMAAFAVGITSFGEPERIFEKFNHMMAGRNQIVLNSDDENVTEAKTSAEEEAYQKIKDEFGFDPVRILYLPEGMIFEESTVFREMQSVQIIYKKVNMNLRYEVNVNYCDGSIGMDIEDKTIGEKRIKVGGTSIEVRKYSVEGTMEEKIIATFVYENMQYIITSDNIKEAEFEKILKNLKFF